MLEKKAIQMNKERHMILIDWISPDRHAFFNESLLSVLDLASSPMFVFSEKLRIEGQCTTVVPCTGARFQRAWKVFNICWINRKNLIFLLSYDPVLVPVLQLYCHRVFLYEHNTTPEGAGYTKHALWQKLFFRKFVRFSQYLSQHETLSCLGQKSIFLGSPLRKNTEVLKRSNPSVYLVPGNRRTKISELYKLKEFIGDGEVIMGRAILTDAELEAIRKDINIVPVLWIDLDKYLPMTKALVVTTSSRTRGSGWFNEAIRFGIPLIITNSNVQKIFETTFPNYPYIRIDQIQSENQLNLEIKKIDRYNRDGYIAEYNDELRRKFFDTIEARC